MPKRIIILGAHGRLGAALNRLWGSNEGSILPLTRHEIDFSQPLSAVEAFAQYRIQEGDSVINTAALTDVDRCEREPVLAETINAITPSLLAEHCAQQGARFVHLSTDYVFDGKLRRSYEETDEPAPLSHYGRSKLAGEEGILAASKNHVIARVSWVFGPDRPSFIDQILQRALKFREVAAVDDKTSSPSFTHDLAVWLCFFFDSALPGGIYHLCNSGSCSWRDYGAYALQVAAKEGAPLLTTEVKPLSLASMENFQAVRPAHTSLSTKKMSRLSGVTLRSWQEAVEEYVTDQVNANLLRLKF